MLIKLLIRLSLSLPLPLILILLWFLRYLWLLLILLVWNEIRTLLTCLCVCHTISSRILSWRTVGTRIIFTEIRVVNIAH